MDHEHSNHEVRISRLEERASTTTQDLTEIRSTLAAMGERDEIMGGQLSELTRDAHARARVVKIACYLFGTVGMLLIGLAFNWAIGVNDARHAQQAAIGQMTTKIEYVETAQRDAREEAREQSRKLDRLLELVHALAGGQQPSP